MLDQKEKDKLISKYRNLLGFCRPYLKKGDTTEIRKALDLAYEAESDRKTALNEPGIMFPLDVAEILAVEMGLGRTSLMASMLFDAFNEQRISEKELLKRFDNQLVKILKDYKRISSLKTEKTALHSENFIRLLFTLTDDVRVVLLKIAEILYFIRILDALPLNLQKKTASDAYYLYAPIAHRLGLYAIKTELEDLSMKFLYRDDYQLITTKLKETKESRKQYLAAFIAPIEHQLKREGLQVEVKGRSKSVHSIWTKMKNQGVGFEGVYDILAIRIILDSPMDQEKADCWKAYSIVTNIYPPNTSRLRDWISAPKTSGYESLHTTVKGQGEKWVEVQIRTRRMDDIAEKGHAAHWRYKENKFSSDPAEWLRNLRSLLENPDILLESGEESLSMHTDDDSIFVFTPQGDLKKLQTGSSVLDFAFDIHTDLGFKCSGARVNGKIVPIKHILKNGDEVEIQTTKNQKPKEDWLKFVKSTRARQKIKRALKENLLREAEIGKESLSRKFKNWKIPFTDEVIDKTIKLLKFKTPMDLYYAISTEKIDTQRIKEVLLPPEKPDVQLPAAPEAESKTSTRKTEERRDDILFLDENLVNINYTLAPCCNPVFGDEVFGFVTISKGVTIHRTTCPNSREMQSRYDYRLVNVKWRSSPSSNSFQTQIKITGIDTLGIVNTISDIISNDMKVNMRSISVESDKGIFEGIIKVYIQDVKHLETLIHKLLKVKGVLKATRIDHA